MATTELVLTDTVEREVPAAESEPPASVAPVPPVEAGGGDGGEGGDGEAVRRWGPWDAVTVLLTATVMLGVAHWELLRLDPDPKVGWSPFIEKVSVAVGVLAVAGFAAVLAWTRPPLARLPRLLTDVWVRPPSPFAAFLLGAILASPILARYSPMLAYDSDSARLVASITYVQNGHLGYFADIQEPYLAHVLIGPFLAVGGLPAAKLFALLSVMVLAGVLSYVAYQGTKVMWAAVAAPLVLFTVSPLLDQSGRLPMYPTMLAIGTMGAWYCYRAMSDERPRWPLFVIGGVLVALTPEAHAVGQLFLAVPALVVVFAPGIRQAALRLAGLYGVVLAAMVPRIWINLSKGGLHQFSSTRDDYWISQKYLNRIQEDFWEHSVYHETRQQFVEKLPDVFYSLHGPYIWMTLAAAAVGFVLFVKGPRARIFALAVLSFFVLAITAKKIPDFGRYYAPVWPGLVVLAAVGIGGPLAKRRPQWLNVPLKVAGAVALVAVGSQAVRTFELSVSEFNAAIAAADRLPGRQILDAIDDDRGVIGARAHHVLLSFEAGTPTWGDQFLTEEEYVTYLTWPSDDEVIEMMERHDIGWVLVHPHRQLELEYNDTWLQPTYGLHARQVEMVQESPEFCRRLVVGGWELFEREPCAFGVPEV